MLSLELFSPVSPLDHALRASFSNSPSRSLPVLCISLLEISQAFAGRSLSSKCQHEANETCRMWSLMLFRSPSDHLSLFGQANDYRPAGISISLLILASAALRLFLWAPLPLLKPSPPTPPPFLQTIRHISAAIELLPSPLEHQYELTSRQLFGALLPPRLGPGNPARSSSLRQLQDLPPPASTTHSLFAPIHREESRYNSDADETET